MDSPSHGQDVAEHEETSGANNVEVVYFKPGSGNYCLSGNKLQMQNAPFRKKHVQLDSMPRCPGARMFQTSCRQDWTNVNVLQKCVGEDQGRIPFVFPGHRSKR